jgi:hypothetical protein
MQLISSVTVGAGGASSMVFSSIPQTFTDLFVLVSARHTNPFNNYLVAQLNSTTSGYKFRGINANGSSVNSFTNATGGYNGAGMYFGNIGGTDYTANVFSNCQLLIPNYTGAVAKQGIGEGLFENNDTVAQMMTVTCQSTVTAAVTTLTLIPASTTFPQYSTAYLYGILKGSGGASVA